MSRQNRSMLLLNLLDAPTTLANWIRASIVLTIFYPATGLAAAEVTQPVEKPLVVVENLPPIQMLLPDFAARELPLKLTNINNLAYSPDGRLFALCYNGNIYQLKDTDGDGLEDAEELYFNNEHGDIPPSIGMTWGPGGLYIASHKRVIRLLDRREGGCELQTVASGWVDPANFGGSNLDAVGIAVDPKGTVYFTLSCDNWSDAYRVGKEAIKSDYNLYSERGTVQRVSPDWKQRTTVCTGLRFAVSMAFNSQGDLFCTDQEGATWLPNGNPLDELLLIEPNRHYGFPPRHPRYLPNVIDEPSVSDYGPQHQSTCGLHFNEPTAEGKPTFGPIWWRGDAIVAGESRGKIWRTKLVKTPAGYVAKNELLACLTMLTIDAVPTPQGDLIVACHSGKPDWGTGPQGIGKLFKISYSDPATPQPVLAYAASRTETRIVFDRPLDPLQLKNLAKASHVTMGAYVTAGERYETFRPGYQAVKNQQTLPRFELPVLSAGLTADNRTVVLQTTPRTEAVNYAIELPQGAEGFRPHDEKRGEFAQRAGIDLLSDLTGVETRWRDSQGSKTWSGWLPHFDLKVADQLTAASEEHRQLFQLAKQSGELALKAQLDLWSMLHPAVQPEAKLDFEYPPETVTVVFKAGAPLEFHTSAQVDVRRINDREVRLAASPKLDQWLPLEMKLATGSGDPTLDVSWHTAEDERPRALMLRRILVPWATPRTSEPPKSRELQLPEIAGGDWQRGKALFFGEQAQCGKCHQIGGEGHRIGPDLSNLVFRDYASVMRDITEPSAAINPEHITYNVMLNDGRVKSGVLVSNSADEIELGDSKGVIGKIQKNEIDKLAPTSVSSMPEGLLKPLDDGQRRDLLTFLLTAGPAGTKGTK